MSAKKPLPRGHGAKTPGTLVNWKTSCNSSHLKQSQLRFSCSKKVFLNKLE